jgi:hypothetical protein
MQQGICSLSAVPLRSAPAESAEMVNQVLFGESYNVLEVSGAWLRIALHHDGYEGWLSAAQHLGLPAKSGTTPPQAPVPVASNLIEIVAQENGDRYFPIFLGSLLPGYTPEKQKVQLAEEVYQYNGPAQSTQLTRKQLHDLALQYLDAPYFWGGRSPFGIDCSGLVQMVYRLAGYHIPRDSSQQAQEGHTLSFIEEAELGDLAFFDNEEGAITHVGIILEDHHILHGSGKVRIDRLDQTGIFNPELGRHTHRLRVMKKIIGV